MKTFWKTAVVSVALLGGLCLTGCQPAPTHPEQVLLEHRVLYENDTAGIESLTQLLGMEDLGYYIINSEGDGLVIDFEVTPEDIPAFQATMEKDAVVLLCMVDHLEVIKWSFPDGNEVVQKTMTLQQADEIVGGDVKSYSGSARRAGELLEKLDMEDALHIGH